MSGSFFCWAAVVGLQCAGGCAETCVHLPLSTHHRRRRRCDGCNYDGERGNRCRECIKATGPNNVHACKGERAPCWVAWAPLLLSHQSRGRQRKNPTLSRVPRALLLALAAAACQHISESKWERDCYRCVENLSDNGVTSGVAYL